MIQKLSLVVSFVLSLFNLQLQDLIVDSVKHRVASTLHVEHRLHVLKTSAELIEDQL